MFKTRSLNKRKKHTTGSHIVSCIGAARNRGIVLRGSYACAVCPKTQKLGSPQCERRTTSYTLLLTIGHVSTWQSHERTNSTSPLPLLLNHASSLNQIEQMHGLRKNRKPRQCITSSALLLLHGQQLALLIMSFET